MAFTELEEDLNAATAGDQNVQEAAVNPTGSAPSTVVQDAFSANLKGGPKQGLFGNNFKDSMLNNPQSVSGDERQKGPVPMYPYGFEGQGDPLFTLSPTQKG